MTPDAATWLVQCLGLGLAIGLVAALTRAR